MDHDQDVLALLKLVLEHEGVTAEMICTQDKDTDELTRSIHDFQPKVVIYDLGLVTPSHDGFEKWQQLAALPAANVGWVLTTTNPFFFPGREPKCRMRILMSRPFSIDDIVKAIRFFLGAQRV